MNAIDIASTQLKIDEGLKLKPYLDTRGKITIGYGRNLSDNGINQAEADAFLKSDIAGAALDALAIFPNLFDLDEARQAVLINMCFNMGKATLSTFRDLRMAIAIKHYEAAATAMERSLWASEVGARAQRLIIIMRGTNIEA